MVSLLELLVTVAGVIYLFSLAFLLAKAIAQAIRGVKAERNCYRNKVGRWLESIGYEEE